MHQQNCRLSIATLPFQATVSEQLMFLPITSFHSSQTQAFLFAPMGYDVIHIRYHETFL
jgi:hypothetical protein